MATSFSLVDLTHEERQKLTEIRQRKNVLLQEIQQLQDELEKTTTKIQSLDVFVEDADSRLKMVLHARKKFNENPKKGLKYMFESGLLPEKSEFVAKLLFDCEGLKKAAVGDYLGEMSDFNVEVLASFVRLHDFQGLSLVQALRNFLWHFRLPGEAQKIDRIMESFAKRYCEQNLGIFDRQDTCYTLSFAVIMINTSLHNPSVKQRMTLEDFLNMTSSINVTKELATSVYNSIRLEAFKFPEDECPEMFKNAEKKGWLMKQGSRHKTWNRRWFVLNDKCLYYFEFATDKEPKGIIPLENVRVRVSGDSKARTNCFEIYSKITDVIKACKTDSEGRLVEGQHSIYRMAAPNREEMHNWIAAIQRSLNKDHYFEMLQSRRGRLGAGQSDPSLNKSQ